MVEAYAPLVHGIARPFVQRYTRGDADMGRDIRSAGYEGLLKAAEKFDPDRGVRFSTYAQWWVKAKMQNFCIENASLVGMPKTSDAKKLFFNLRRVETEIGKQYPDLSGEELDVALAAHFEVPLKTVRLMRGAMQGDFSLNARQGHDEEGREWIDTLEADMHTSNPESIVASDDETEYRRRLFVQAMDYLTDRERDILTRRRLDDTAETLESIAGDYGLTKERIRQLENLAFEKVERKVKTLTRTP